MPADEEKVADIMYDVNRLSEMSAFMDHEIQRFVVLIQSVPDPEARALIFKACGPQLPKFLEMAEQFRGMGVGFMRLNESVDRLLKEGLAAAAEQVAKGQTYHEEIETPPALSPSQVDPVFAEGYRQLRESQQRGQDEE